MTFIFLSPVGLSVEERLVVYVHFLVNGHNQNLVGQRTKRTQQLKSLRIGKDACPASV